MMWDPYKGQGTHPDLKPRLQAVFPEHAVPAVSVRQHPSREGGWELGAETTRACSRQAADVCSVWTERAEALSQRAECALPEWSLNSLLSEAPKGLREEAP